MSAIGFALLSLAFAAALEVSYKRYSLRPRSRGMYLAGIGVVWGMMQVGIAWYAGEPVIGSTAYGPALGFGLAAGISVAASNLLLIESLTRIEASLGSTVYRLNTIWVVLLSFVFLGEVLSPLKLAAIAFGVAAALTLYGGTGGADAAAQVRGYFWLAVLASVLRACFGVISKAAINFGVSTTTILLISAGCWVAGGLAYAYFRERRVQVTVDTVGYALVSGTLVVLVVNTLIWGLQRGDASTVIPVANLSFVAVLAISMAWGMERLTLRKCIALSMAAACIWLMASAV